MLHHHTHPEVPLRQDSHMIAVLNSSILRPHRPLICDAMLLIVMIDFHELIYDGGDDC